MIEWKGTRDMKSICWSCKFFIPKTRKVGRRCLFSRSMPVNKCNLYVRNIAQLVFTDG